MNPKLFLLCTWLPIFIFLLSSGNTLAQCAHPPPPLGTFTQHAPLSISTVSPGLEKALEEQRNLCKRTARAKRAVIIFTAVGIGTRLASRQAYMDYVNAPNNTTAQSAYDQANLLHKLSLGGFGIAGVSWLVQIGGKVKNSP